jgi:hypothetical protein
MGEAVRKVGEIADAGGYPLAVGTCRGSVIIGDTDLDKGISWALTNEQADDLAAMLITALWQAARQAGESSG